MTLADCSSRAAGVAIARSWLPVRSRLLLCRRISSSPLLAPAVYAELAAELAGKISVAEVDCEALPAVCKGEGVMGYPQLFL